jgi:hypothetical protein
MFFDIKQGDLNSLLCADQAVKVIVVPGQSRKKLARKTSGEGKQNGKRYSKMV